jgi:ketosteroid isomerase-like protein
MSEENVEVVRRCLDAYSAGDNEASLAAFDPDVVFDQSIRPDGGVFHGPDGIAEAMRTWTGAFEDWRLQVEEIIDAGDRVLVIATQFGRGKGSGVETEQRDFSVYTVRNGKIVHLKAFLDRQEALEAAGLQE